MRKFTIQSRKDKTSIFEVEVEILTAMDDSAVLWLKPGEYRARVLKPTIFHQKVEKTVEGKKETTLVPDVWCWHAFYETEDEARAQAAKWIQDDVDFAIRKHREPPTPEQVQASIDAIEVVRL
jgi:hypothetical protein